MRDHDCLAFIMKIKVTYGVTLKQRERERDVDAQRDILKLNNLRCFFMCEIL